MLVVRRIPITAQVRHESSISALLNQCTFHSLTSLKKAVSLFIAFFPLIWRLVIKSYLPAEKTKFRRGLTQKRQKIVLCICTNWKDIFIPFLLYFYFFCVRMIYYIKYVIYWRFTARFMISLLLLQSSLFFVFCT